MGHLIPPPQAAGQPQQAPNDEGLLGPGAGAAAAGADGGGAFAEVGAGAAGYAPLLLATDAAAAAIRSGQAWAAGQAGAVAVTPEWQRDAAAAMGPWAGALQDGWQALQLSSWAALQVAGPAHDAGGVLAAMLRAAAAHGGDTRAVWLSLVQLAVLLGLHRALHSEAGQEGGQDARVGALPLAGIRWGAAQAFGFCHRAR